ncbi:hypothetical protein DFH06DRAFT_1146628 [Mycena polygramma]|nr:hypothetical protein DFH06DRAFT_1146628 [Mycena polygramma]
MAVQLADWNLDSPYWPRDVDAVVEYSVNGVTVIFYEEIMESSCRWSWRIVVYFLREDHETLLKHQRDFNMMAVLQPTQYSESAEHLLDSSKNARNNIRYNPASIPQALDGGLTSTYRELSTSHVYAEYQRSYGVEDRTLGYANSTSIRILTSKWNHSSEVERPDRPDLRNLLGDLGLCKPFYFRRSSTCPVKQIVLFNFLVHASLHASKSRLLREATVVAPLDTDGYMMLPNIAGRLQRLHKGGLFNAATSDTYAIYHYVVVAFIPDIHDTIAGGAGIRVQHHLSWVSCWARFASGINEAQRREGIVDPRGSVGEGYLVDFVFSHPIFPSLIRAQPPIHQDHSASPNYNAFQQIRALPSA